MALTWMKTGAASQQLAKQNEAEVEQRKEQQGKMFRWGLKDKEDGACTFVDGDLSAEGYLLPPRFYEHHLYLNGSWGNYFVCPAKTNPEAGHKCPICEGGDRPNLMAAFTVIDHRVFKSKTEGQPDITNRRKLLIANTSAFEMLNKIALKRGGLVGARFDVSRTGDKAPRVGSMFDFMEKKPVEELKALYTRTYEKKDDKGNKTKETVCDFEPANYEEEIIFRTPEQLRDLGFGKPGGGSNPSSGLNAAATQGQAQGQGKPLPKAADTTDYEAQL